MAGQSFKFWTSYLEAIDVMDDATAGRVVKALARNVFYGEQPDFSDNELLGAVYKVMREQSETSREMSDKARERGQRSGESRRKKSSTGTAFEKCSNEKRRSEANRKEASPSSLEKKATPRGAAAAAPGGAPTAPREPRDPHDVSDAPLEQWPPPGWTPPPPLNNS